MPEFTAPQLLALARDALSNRPKMYKKGGTVEHKGVSITHAELSPQALHGGAVWHPQHFEEGGTVDDMAPAPMGHNNPPSSMGFEGLHPQLISQRLPQNVRATENPNQQMLLSNMSAAKANPTVFSHNVGLIKQYGLLPQHLNNLSDDEYAEHFINHLKDNFLYLHDNMPEHLRNRAKEWYVGANKFAQALSDRHNVPLSASAAAIAAMSPQKDWFQNASLAERLMDIHHAHQNTPYTKEMENTANRIFGKGKFDALLNDMRGKTYGELSDPRVKAAWVRLFDQTYHDPSHRKLTPEGEIGDWVRGKNETPSRMAWGSLSEIRKGISALMGGASREQISELMGERHKIRHFYNNILDPFSPTHDTTIDTHAVAGGTMLPLGANGVPVAHNFKNSPEAGFEAAKGDNDTGVQGTYPFYLEALSRAADERGTLPREMQSITWEGARALFPDTFKTQANIDAVQSIWNDYHTGKISANDARDKIFEFAGGMSDPDWTHEGRDHRPDAEVSHTTYQRKLPASQVRGGAPGMVPGIGGGGSDQFTGLEEPDIRKFQRHRELTRAAREAFTPPEREETGLPQSWIPRSRKGGGLDVSKAFSAPVTNVFDPAPHAAESFEKAGISAPTMLELKRGVQSAKDFHAALSAARGSHPNGSSVTLYDPKDYKGMRLFLAQDGQAGFALKGDDIVSVFNNAKGPHRHVSNSMLQLAVAQGGRKLDAYDTELPHIYSRNKFKVVSRLPWDDKEKRDDWNYAAYKQFNNGRPDVVFMTYDPAHEGVYHSSEGDYAKDYDAAVKKQDNAVKGVKRKHGFASGGGIPHRPPMPHPAMRIPGVHIVTSEAGEPFFHG